MTEYVVSRWYRAPEIILLMASGYSKASKFKIFNILLFNILYSNAKNFNLIFLQVDIWSAGCIIYEMYTNKPLFPGKNPHNQLELIIDLVGYPNDTKISRDILEVLNKETKPNRVNFYEYFKEIPDKLGFSYIFCFKLFIINKLKVLLFLSYRFT